MHPDHANAVAEAMAGLWRAEFPATVSVMSAVSDAERDYRPHGKSRTAWELVTHLATSDIWFLDSIAAGAFAFDREKAKQTEAQFRNVSDVVAFYADTFPAKLARVTDLPQERLAEPVDFFGMMKMSRAQWIGFAGNHSVHHRGQLSAYLRSMGCKVPDIYGPSADSEDARGG